MNSRVDWSKIKYVLYGLMVGIVVGIIVSLFRILITFSLNFIEEAYSVMRAEPAGVILWIFISLVVAGVVIILIRDEPNIIGSGIQDIEGHLHGVMKLKWFSIFWRKFIGGTLSIGSGLALGREGPSIQIGGVLGIGVNKLLKGNRSQEKVLLSAGASAGLASAFNTPVSGVMFIMEEVHHKFSKILLLTAFSAAVTSNFIAYQIFGVEPIINFDVLEVFPLTHYTYLVLLGIVLGVVGWGYQGVLIRMSKLYEKLPIPNYLHPLLPFLIVIPIGLFLPNMLGSGEGLISGVSQNEYTIGALLGIFVFRFIFMQISYGAGLPGGIFLPVLGLGAIVGGIYGNGAMMISDLDPMFIEAFVVYSMGGLLTSVTKASLTSVLLIIEMTGSVTHLMPLAVVCLSSYIVSDFLRSGPIYEVLLDKKVKTPYSIFEGNIEEYEMHVEPNSFLDNRVIKELNMPMGSQIVYIQRNFNEFIPRASTILHSNDTLVIHADTGVMPQVISYMNQENEDASIETNNSS